MTLAPPSPDALVEESRHPIRSGARTAPTWPLTFVLAGFPIWWITGFGDVALCFAMAAIVHQFAVRRSWPLAPSGFGVWLLFLGWMLVSGLGIDTPGRMLGFAYRTLLYAAATAAFLYVYSFRATFTLRRVAGLLTGFWTVCVVGGYIGLTFPLFVWRTPLSYIIPSSIRSNELVNEMVVRRVSQGNPDALIPQSQRPSAPFLFTNGWGAAYSILTPIVIAYAFEYLRGWRRGLLLAAVVASTVPAFLTLNRGMFIGLGIAGVYMAFRGVMAGNPRILIGIAAAGVVALVAFASVPAGDRLDERLETSSTTDDRASLYTESIARSLESPVFGYGAPRPSADNLPSVGTHGQVWTVMFSHGIPALILFVVWILVAWHQTAHHRSGVGLAINASLVVVSVEMFYYGFVGMALFLVMIGAAAAWRTDAIGLSTPHRIGAGRASTGETV